MKLDNSIRILSNSKPPSPLYYLRKMISQVWVDTSGRIGRRS